MIDTNSSDQKLLECMKDERIHSPRDLSISCQMNEPAVRYQLRKLARLGLVRKCPGSGLQLKPGRKSDYYRLSSPNETSSGLLLCQTILANIDTVLTGKDPAVILANWFTRSIERGAKQQQLSVKELVNWLNQNHYAARWLAGKTGPEILVSNCPYCDLQTGSDILCRMDTAIINRFTGLSWEKDLQMEPSFKGGTCRFFLMS
jgi:predicted ArsR family transcriptional regulator